MYKYYFAALLDQAKSWFDQETDKLWVEIERAIVIQRDLPSLFLAASTQRPLFYPEFPTIDATLSAWRALNEQANNSKAIHRKITP